jgi:hypothetical protein
MEQIDTTKIYQCYFCKEAIEFSVGNPEINKYLIEKGSRQPLQWNHVATHSVSCRTVATPSNIEIESVEV